MCSAVYKMYCWVLGEDIDWMHNAGIMETVIYISGLSHCSWSIYSSFITPISSDTIILFLPADARIQRGYQRLSSSKGQGSKAPAAGDHYSGVLGQLMEKGQLSLDLIKANITELMAGGVDTVRVCEWLFSLDPSPWHWLLLSPLQTAVPLQFALFELGRNPDVQERVRQQVRTSWAQAGGDPQKALQGAPLLRGTTKEILR